MCSQQARRPSPNSDIAESSGKEAVPGRKSQSGNLNTMQIASVSDCRGPAVNKMPLVSTTAVFALVTCGVTLLSTAALGACNATLRGELVPDDSPKQRFRAVPQKLLFFSLDEIAEDNGHTVEKNFQSFTFPNTKMTFPIPFVLNIDSPKDCPKELQLSVRGSDRDGVHYEFPMRGWKTISLEKLEFESVIVIPPTF
jgi:hypothetical protein